MLVSTDTCPYRWLPAPRAANGNLRSDSSDSSRRARPCSALRVSGRVIQHRASAKRRRSSKWNRTSGTASDTLEQRNSPSGADSRSSAISASVSSTVTYSAMVMWGERVRTRHSSREAGGSFQGSSQPVERVLRFDPQAYTGCWEVLPERAISDREGLVRGGDRFECRQSLSVSPRGSGTVRPMWASQIARLLGSYASRKRVDERA